MVWWEGREERVTPGNQARWWKTCDAKSNKLKVNQFFLSSSDIVMSMLQKSDRQLSREKLEERAFDMLYKHVVRTQQDAATRVDIPLSTFNHRLHGRPSRATARAKQQKLTIREEELVVERCYLRCLWGFPPVIFQVQRLAQDILQRRIPNEVLGKRWISNFYKRHPEVKSKFSKQMDYIRSIRGNDPKIIEDFFTSVRYSMLSLFSVYFTRLIEKMC